MWLGVVDIPLPCEKARGELIKLSMRTVPLADDVDIPKLAAATEVCDTLAAWSTTLARNGVCVLVRVCRATAVLTSLSSAAMVGCCTLVVMLLSLSLWLSDVSPSTAAMMTMRRVMAEIRSKGLPMDEACHIHTL